MGAGPDQGGELMVANPVDARYRCRWCADDGRCPSPHAFPGKPDVPPFCLRHLAKLEPWIEARAKVNASAAESWIEWARRNAQHADAVRTMLGDQRPGHGTRPMHA